MSKLIYCATPSRLVHKITEIMDFVTNQGLALLHPFQALPYERFEGNPGIGRAKSMEWCLRLVNVSDEFWMFGVSRGTLEEAVYAAGIAKPIRLKFDGFDSEWKKYYSVLGHKYNNLLDPILSGSKK